MKHLNFSLSFDFVARMLMYLLPIAGLVSIVVLLVLGQFNLLLLSSYLVVPMIAAPIIYLSYRDNSRAEHPVHVNARNQTFKVLLVGYNALFSTSVFLLYASTVRPFLYYVTLAAIAVIILLEILLFDITTKRKNIILLQVTLLSANIIWGVTLKYYYFFGRTDVFVHAWLADNVINEGHLVLSVFQIYTAFPLWHILSSYVSQLSAGALPVYKLMFIVGGFAFIVILITGYVLAQRIFRNDRYALLASLLISFSPAFVFSGMQSIPRSVDTLFMMFLLLLLFYRSDRTKYFLVMFLTFTIISYHTVTICFVLAILLMIYLARRLFLTEGERADGSFLTSKYFAVTLFFVAMYWIGASFTLLQWIYDNITRSAPSGVLTSSIMTVPEGELFNYLQYALVLFIIIIGVLHTLNTRKMSGMAKILSLVSLVLVSVSFPGPLLLVNKLAANFNLARFEMYAFPLMAIAAAAGLALIFDKSPKSAKTLVCLFFAMLMLLSVSNDFVASDNPLVKREFYTYYLTQEETIAFDHLANITRGYVLSDYITVRYLSSSPYGSNSSVLQVDSHNMTFLRNSSRDLLLIRTSELNKRPLMLLNQTKGLFEAQPQMAGRDHYYDKDSSIWSTLRQYKKIYDTGVLSGLT